MKLKITLLLLFVTFFCQSQIINFPDPVFKAKLLSATSANGVAKDLDGNPIGIDANSNGEIEVSEALAISEINAVPILDDDPVISSISGIEYFMNLVDLRVQENSITQIDVSMLHNLKTLRCYENNLTSLNVQGCTLLEVLQCQDNNLTTLDLNNMTKLYYLLCSSNQLTEMNIDNCIALDQLQCFNNQLTTMNLNHCNHLSTLIVKNNNLSMLYVKNNSSYINFMVDFSENPNLEYICTANPLFQSKATSYGYTDCVINPYCSFVPSGTYNTISGDVTYDMNADGCDVADSKVTGCKIKCTASDDEFTFSNTAGHYKHFSESTGFTVSPVLENPSYFTVTPANAIVNFPDANNNIQVQDFCIAPNGVHNDLEVTVLPVRLAIPGNSAEYSIIYRNKGTHPQSGTVTLAFDGSVLNFSSATPTVSAQATGLLTWNFTDLMPFESRQINVSVNLNTPTDTPPLTGGDMLTYVATVSGAADETIADNQSLIKQMVVNSYDPNDKACLEGTSIAPEMVGDYVHYIVRFENTGTANAQNIVVADIIDTTKFDVSTLVPTSSSHPCETRLTSPGKAEFIFENIDLPFDDANNDGYIAFKIKTKPSLVVGNSFSNTASIYFDFNFPIVTNTFVTTVQALGTGENETPKLTVYPNPVTDFLNLHSQSTVEKAEIYDLGGRLLSCEEITGNRIAMHHFASGQYIVKIFAENGVSVLKIIKE